MKLKMQVLDADYFLNVNKPVIRIFGKLQDGSAVCILYDKLSPYFYVSFSEENRRQTLEKLAEHKEIRNVEEVEKFTPFGYHGKKSQMFKVTLTNPQDVPKVREKLAAAGLAQNIFEADIMFKYRFMIDNGIRGMQWVEVEAEREQRTVRSKIATYRAHAVRPLEEAENAPLRYLALDIECVPSDPTKPIDAKKDPIVMISLAFTPEFRGHKSLVLTAKPFSGEGAKGLRDEKEMLSELLSIIDNYDPDVITGYNINAFDMPYILERLKQNKLSAALGRSDKEAYSTTGINPEFFINGRVVADPYQILKRDPWVKFHRYDLNTVAKQLLNEEKMSVEYGEMAGLWNGDREKLSRFVEYARRDAELSMRLLVGKGMLDKFFEISKISGLLLQDVFGGQTKRIETMLLHEFRDRGFVMPSMPSRRELHKSTRDRKDKGLKGATVLEPEKGLHSEGCILVLDFKSLYPSIMRTFNISPDTVVIGKEDGLSTHLSPSGAHFVTEEVRKGIFPDVLTKLLSARHSAKKLMKTKSGEEKRILNAKQLALKDISNSFYGYTGYIRARLYMIDVANSVTAYGRENIEKTKKLVEENFDVSVVYGDTDSLFVKTKTANLDEAKATGEKISKFITEKLPGHLELEFEKIYRTFLILTKKRYAGWKFEYAGDKWADGLEMKGIETVRRDWCPLVSEAMLYVLNTVLKEGDVPKAISYVREILEKLRKNQIPLEKLTIIKGITQAPESYKGILPHIELAKKLKNRNPHDAPKIGDRLGFVIIKGNMMLSKRAEDPEYAEKNGMQIDSEYYIESQLFPPIERILSAVGIEKSEVFGNGHQMTFSDIFGHTKRKAKQEISIEYSQNPQNTSTKEAKKEETKEQTLGGLDEFVCKKCGRGYRRMPLQGICDCGGSLALSWHGSTGKKITLK